MTSARTEIISVHAETLSARTEIISVHAEKLSARAEIVSVHAESRATGLARDFFSKIDRRLSSERLSEDKPN